MHFNLTVLRRMGVCVVKLVSPHNLFRSLKCEINICCLNALEEANMV